MKLKSKYFQICIIKVLLSCSISVTSTFALADSSTAQLQGADRSQVLKLLGQPTRSSSVPSSSTTNSSETLYYGDSQVSLINNKVSSIFDLGEIKLLLSKQNNILEETSSGEVWPNPWTTPKSILKIITYIPEKIVGDEGQ